MEKESSMIKIVLLSRAITQIVNKTIMTENPEYIIKEKKN